MLNSFSRTDEIVHLVGLIYGSAVDAGKQTEVLRHFNELVQGAAAQLFTRDSASGAVLHSQISGAVYQQAHENYLSEWCACDPRLDMLATMPARQVLQCHERFDENYVAGSTFYRDFFVPHGFRWSLAGMYRSSPGVHTVIADVRAIDAAPFDDQAAATLRQLMPHFERASAISSKLERQCAAVRSATDMVRLLPTPCLFTDHLGRCLEGNDAFSQALEPLALRLVTGRVRFTHPDVQERWEAALFETHATALARTMPFADSAGKEWEAHLIPWHSLLEQADAADKQLILVIFGVKHAEQRPATGSMAGAAKLTRAEAEVLASLLKGLPAKAIATQRSASVNTVRTQIMAILEKTGYNSQKELMASFSASALPDSAVAGASAAESNPPSTGS